MRYLALILITLLPALRGYALQSIYISAPGDVMLNPISQLAVEDVRMLLKQAFNKPVNVNFGQPGEVVIQLPEIDTARMSQPSRFQQSATYPYTPYPDHHYTWTSHREEGVLYLTLQTPSHQGISMGLYGLLQVRLGFYFYHPRETIIPQLSEWPLPDTFSWQASPVFDKKGFHIHAQHPLEITEQLLNEEHPNAWHDVKEYIDWLARNGQNYFEFNLLESIDRKGWPAHAQRIVNYCHDRGILAGVDISLHMIQQKAFMLYLSAPRSFRSKKAQIKKNLRWLMLADWDYLAMEFSTTEFTGGNEVKKEKLRLWMIEYLQEHYDVALTGREHVVKDEAEVGGGERKKYEMTAREDSLDKLRLVLIHTVMFYTIFEEQAPVYENENLQHMLAMLKEEMQVRETWYYPESAYWITFDNSVPMLLLPYLKARLDDIELMEELGVPGHITFTSGWEWGYWMTDWSIARWSWNHEWQGQQQAKTPMQHIQQLMGSEQYSIFLDKALTMQQRYIKDSNLIQYMTAHTVTDEAPGPMNLQLHPRPKYSLKHYRYKATAEQLDSLEADLQQLRDFGKMYGQIIHAYEDQVEDSHLFAEGTQRFMLNEEIMKALFVTAHRAYHRSLTLQAIINKRRLELGLPIEKPVAELLAEAAKVRHSALEEVHDMEEEIYRYPVELLAHERYSRTAYPHGYLYTVHNLHFWDREEQQVLRDKYGFLHKNIWKVFRIIGVYE